MRARACGGAWPRHGNLRQLERGHGRRDGHGGGGGREGSSVEFAPPPEPEPEPPTTAGREASAAPGRDRKRSARSLRRPTRSTMKSSRSRTSRSREPATAVRGAAPRWGGGERAMPTPPRPATTTAAASTAGRGRSRRAATSAELSAKGTPRHRRTVVVSFLVLEDGGLVSSPQIVSGPEAGAARSRAPGGKLVALPAGAPCGQPSGALSDRQNKSIFGLEDA